MQKHKKILLSGANGSLARLLLNRMPQNEYILLVRDKSKINFDSNKFNFIAYTYSEFLEKEFFKDNIDLFIHAGFARSENTQELLNSLTLTSQLLEKVCKIDGISIINISSISVYSKDDLNLSKETDILSPSSYYGIAKATSELLLNNYCKNRNYTNIRLASLSGNDYPQHILTKFIKNALNNKTINIVGGQQTFGFIDAIDAINALELLIDSDSSKWHKAYNISTNTQYNIVEMASRIKDILKTDYSIDINIILEKNDNFYFSYGLNSDLFMNQFDWTPKYQIEDTIKSIIDKEIKQVQ